MAAAGIDADHEAITRKEVLNRLRLGIWTMLRYSFLRPDLPELLRSVTEDGISTHRLIMTTDGPAPQFVEEHGLVDGMLRVAVDNGVSPMQALQMVTINPATLFRIDGQVGGRHRPRADLLLLPDLASFRPQTVITRGAWRPRAGGFAPRFRTRTGTRTAAGHASTLTWISATPHSTR